MDVGNVGVCVVPTHLSIRTSLEGSIDARREEGSDPAKPEGRRSEGLRDAGFEDISCKNTLGLFYGDVKKNCKRC